MLSWPEECSDERQFSTILVNTLTIALDWNGKLFWMKSASAMGCLIRKIK
jgi:hypothetical protein